MQDNEMYRQVVKNATDVEWIKSHMKTQTGLLVAIFMSILGGIGTLIVSATEKVFFDGILSVFINLIF